MTAITNAKHIQFLASVVKNTLKQYIYLSMIGSKLFIRCHATSDPRLGYNILYTFWLHGVPLLTIVCFLFNMSRHFVSTNRYRNNDALKINHGICLDTQHFQFQNHIITNRSMQAKLYWVLLFGQFKQHCRFSSKYFGIH